MEQDEIAYLIELSCEERFDYSLSKISEDKDIWILVNNENQFLKLYAEEENLEYLPIWPSEDLAQRYAADSGDLKPKSIPLPEFLKKWVSGLGKDGIQLGVFPGNDATVWVASAEEFKQDIQEELSNLF